MKKLFLSVLTLLLFYTYTQSQSNAEIIGKTTTDSLVITDGAVTGHIWQAQDATGLGKWVSPGIIGGADNLGNHTATTNLNMAGNGIEKINFLQFVSGATFGDDGMMGLEFGGNQINFAGAQLQFARSLSFALSGGDTFIAEVPGGATPTEVFLGTGGGPVPFGVGGPVNPPAGIPLTSVLTNGGIPSTPSGPFMFAVHGEAWAFDWYAISDARFKKNINPVSSALDKVSKMTAVNYSLDNTKFDYGKVDESKTIGFLAQDLAQAVPEAVKVNANGVHLVRYNVLIPVLAEAIKELDAKVAENKKLQQQVNELTRQHTLILDRLSKLEEAAAQ